MSKLVLPKPRHATSKWDTESVPSKKKAAAAKVLKTIPPYGQRQNYIPRSPEDFGDGGAFPEISVAQYPLGMGKTKASTSNGTLALQTDANGSVRYDLVLHGQGSQSGNKLIQSSYTDLMAKDVPGEGYAKPSEEELKETTDKTRAVLDSIVNGQISSSKIKTSLDQPSVGNSKYVRYTPADQDSEGGANTRIIRMTEAPVDPFEPPKFKLKKVPRGPGSPPAPVMHSPPRKVSAEEQKNWVIPACISNWKNAKGYTIPLDKRLAADGRGLQEVTINDNFAKLSEALFIADRHAREEVKLRADMQNKLAAKEKKDKEERLRMLAQKAREERAGLVSSARTGSPPARGLGLADYGSDSDESGSESEDEEEIVSEKEKQALKEREAIRRDKAKQREREMRMSHMGSETKARVLSESTERDISEKIALGLAQPTLSKEAMFDSRLFNQSSGMSAGFGAEDDYNLYDKPLFNGSSSAAIYRPKRAEEASVVGGVAQDKIDKILGDAKPHRGFKGADADERDAVRDGPVLFEKEADPFGFTEFMGSAKRGHNGPAAEDEEAKKRSRQ